MHEVHPNLKCLNLSINLHFESESNEDSNDDIDFYEFLKDILLPLFASQTIQSQIIKKYFSLKLDCRIYYYDKGPHSNPEEFRELMSALKDNVLPERLVLKFDMESIKIDWDDNDKFRLRIGKDSKRNEQSLKSIFNLISETLSSGKKLIEIEGLEHEWHGEFFSSLNFSMCEELHIVNSFLNNQKLFDIIQVMSWSLL